MDKNLTRPSKKSAVLLVHPAGRNLDLVPAVDRMIRLPDVLRIAGVGRTTWYKLVKAGDAPAGKRVSSNIRAWSERECIAWVASRPSGVAATDPAQD